mgnify:CR=1 FL=1
MHDSPSVKRLSSLMREKLGTLATTVRRGLPRRLQASLFGRPQGLVSIEECRAALDGPIEWLSTDETSRGTEPATMEDTLHWKFHTPYYQKRRHSDVWVARLKGGYIRAGRYALTPDHRLIEEVISEHAVQRGVQQRLATRRPSIGQTRYQRVALLGTHWAGSHFHWLFDVLPRMGILSESGVPRGSIAHYAMPQTAHAPYLEALRHLGVGDGQLIQMGPTDRIYVEDLILPSLPERRGNPPAWVCQFLRDQFLPLADGASAGRPERIYVERRGNREVTNQDAVEEVLARHGITTIRPEEHSLGAQVALFQNAELIVGPHGAGLANIVFASPGTQVVEIFSPNYVNVCNASIASRQDLRYSYLIGEGERPPAGVAPFHVHEDITVNVERLDQWLGSFPN